MKNRWTLFGMAKTVCRLAWEINLDEIVVQFAYKQAARRHGATQPHELLNLKRTTTRQRDSRWKKGKRLSQVHFESNVAFSKPENLAERRHLVGRKTALIQLYLPPSRHGGNSEWFVPTEEMLACAVREIRDVESMETSRASALKPSFSLASLGHVISPRP